MKPLFFPAGAMRRPVSACSAALALLLAALCPPPSKAGEAVESAFTRMDDAACKWDAPASDGEEGADGGCATCPGYAGSIVRLCEGDLRQSVFYGAAVPDEMRWTSFAQFNHAGPTIEWRLSFGEPYATIHRFFITNLNDAGDIDPAHEGQVLVVSTVAGAFNQASCPVGYVDARANANANELARQIADDLAMHFDCRSDKPQFHGTRGRDAGDPTGLSE